MNGLLISLATIQIRLNLSLKSGHYAPWTDPAEATCNSSGLSCCPSLGYLRYLQQYLDLVHAFHSSAYRASESYLIVPDQSGFVDSTTWASSRAFRSALGAIGHFLYSCGYSASLLYFEYMDS